MDRNKSSITSDTTISIYLVISILGAVAFSTRTYWMADANTREIRDSRLLLLEIRDDISTIKETIRQMERRDAKAQKEN